MCRSGSAASILRQMRARRSACLIPASAVSRFVRELMRQIPDERMVYFGDTARLPYGAKSRDTVIRYSRQIVRFLKTKGVKAIVIACNTASSHALKTLAEENDIPVIGVIYAGALSAVRATENGRIGVIGTRGTGILESISEGNREPGSGAPCVSEGLPHVCAARRRGAPSRQRDG